MASHQKEADLVEELSTLSVNESNGQSGPAINTQSTQSTQSTPLPKLSTPSFHESSSQSGSTLNSQSASLPENSTQHDATSYCMTVGIDWAMSLSSVSYGLPTPQTSTPMSKSAVQRPEDSTFSIDSWPGKAESIPVPTVIGYNPATGQIYFGFEACDKLDQNCVVFNMKALIHRSAQTLKMINALEKTAASLGKKTDDFMVDFFRSFRVHILRELKNRIGPKVMERTEIQWLVDAPTCLTPSELNHVNELLRTAGYNNSALASEVEAMMQGCIAAGYIEKPTKGHDLSHIIVDIGHLTTDAGAFHLKLFKEHIKVTEYSASESIICGGSTLSTSFEDLVKDRIRSAGIPEPLLSALCSKIVQQFEDNFKRTFDGTQHFSFNKDADEEFERIQFQFSISSHEMCKLIFEPVLRSIQELIETQVKDLKTFGLLRTEMGLYLCGGLSANLFISEFLKDAFSSLRSIVIVPYEKELLSRGLVIVGATENPSQHISGVTVGIVTDEVARKSDTLGEIPERQYVRWLVGYGQTLSGSINENTVSCIWTTVLKESVLEQGFETTGTLYYTVKWQPNSRYTKVDDLPQDMEKLIFNWRVPASCFRDKDFPYLLDDRHEALRARIMVDVDIRDLSSAAPGLQFSMTLQHDTWDDRPKGKPMHSGGQFFLKTTKTRTLNKAGTLGSRGFDGPVSGDMNNDDRVAKLIPLNRRDRNEQAHSRIKEETAARAKNPVIHSETDNRKRQSYDSGVAGESDREASKKKIMVAMGRGVNTGAAADVDMVSEETLGEENTKVGDDYEGGDVVMGDDDI